MAVYVDDMFRLKMGRFRRMKMSHMIADTDSELHAMADRIGLSRKWFQGDHYDVCLSKRQLAVKNGAIEITLRQLAEKAKKQRMNRAAKPCGLELTQD